MIRGISWALLCAAVLVVAPATGAEVGYSLTHAVERPDVSGSGRGVEGRVNFGGSGERYSADRWSLAIGMVPGREALGDQWFRAPDDDLIRIDAFDEFWHASFVHRWYTRPGRFGWAPRTRLFVGTGVSWRDARTCGNRGCWSGTVAVSSRWAFRQSFGIKWRERVEVAWEHDSTGRVSALNLGDDQIRFTIFVLIGNNR